MKNPIDQIKATIAAKLYFLENKTKSEIADELQLSRFKVARLIDDAIKMKIIKFVIEEQADIDAELSHLLCKKYNLDNVIVGKALVNGESFYDYIPRLTAIYLQNIIKPYMKVGVAWGKTLANTMTHLTNLPYIEIVQTAGIYPNLPLEQNAVGIVNSLAKISNGLAHTFYLPFIVDNKNTKKALLNDSVIQNIMKLYDNLDILITGIGVWTNNNSYMYESLDIDIRNELIKQNVCADIFALPITKDGEFIKSAIDTRGFTMQPQHLKSTTNVIAVAGGYYKYEAILATLKTGYITTLITDYDNAYLLTKE